MICARCGTEHNDPENICPRCFYGRPRQNPKIPKWVLWLGGSIVGAAIIAVAAIFIVQAVQLSISQRWIDGTWENDEMALIIDRDDRRFHLINGQNVLVGRYELNDEELRLISEEGNHYVYYYELVDELTLNISFVSDKTVVRETLTKLDYLEE
mgnify:FL=1